jgi:hypothetical protein
MDEKKLLGLMDLKRRINLEYMGLANERLRINLPRSTCFNWGFRYRIYLPFFETKIPSE